MFDGFTDRARNEPHRDMWTATALCATALAAFGLGWVALDFIMHAVGASIPKLNRSSALAAKAPWLGVPFLLVLFPYLILGRNRVAIRWRDYTIVAALAFVAAIGSGGFLT